MVKFKIVEEVGVVKVVNGAFAVVAVPKKSACEGCSSKICRPDKQIMEIEALNKANAAPGQRVRVVIKPNVYLKGSMVVYGIPALALLFGAIAGKEVLSRFWQGYSPDMVSAVSGFSACLLSVLLIKLWSLSAGTKTELKPVIEEILE